MKKQNNFQEQSQQNKTTKSYRKPYEGGIYYRPSEDRYFIRIPVQNRPKPIIAYAKTEEEAVEKKNQIIAEYVTGKYVDPQKLTLSQWLYEWLPDFVESKVQPNTYFRKLELVRIHIDGNAIGSIPLQQLTSSDFARLYRQLRKTGKRTKKKDEKGNIQVIVSGLAEQTIWHIHHILNPALKMAVKKKKIADNPLDGICPKEIVRDEAAYLKNDEPTKYLQALIGNRYYAAFVLDLALGLRRGELIGLKWDDIIYDPEADEYILQIRRQLIREQDIETGTSSLVLKSRTKTKKSKRIMNIPSGVMEELKAHKARQDQEKALVGKPYFDHGLIFCQANGNMIDTRRIYEVHCKALKTAKIEHVPFHCLRHTFSAMLMEAGEDLDTLRRLLGHTQLSTTVEIYGHLTDKKRRNVAMKMDGIITSIMPNPGLSQPVPENAGM